MEKKEKVRIFLINGLSYPMTKKQRKEWVYFLHEIRLGIKNLFEHDIRNALWTSEHEIKQKTSDYNEQCELVHQRDMDEIQKADMVIALTEYPSTGLGYELGAAQYLNKEIVLLYKKNGEMEGDKSFYYYKGKEKKESELIPSTGGASPFILGIPETQNITKIFYEDRTEAIKLLLHHFSSNKKLYAEHHDPSPGGGAVAPNNELDASA